MPLMYPKSISHRRELRGVVTLSWGTYCTFHNPTIDAGLVPRAREQE